MSSAGWDRRKYPRINWRFIVSYRVLEEADNVDISQTKNLSQGGMLLTTNRPFPQGMRLALEIRLPFDPKPVTLIGKVVESREICKDLIYDTRLEFMVFDEANKKIIEQTIQHFLKKGST